MSVNVLTKSVHLKKILLTNKHTYFAIAYTWLDVSPPIFLLEKKNSSKAFSRGLRCQNWTMHFATKTDVQGTPMPIVPRSPRSCRPTVTESPPPSPSPAKHYPANTRRWTNFASLPGQRRKRWANIEKTLLGLQRLVFTDIKLLAIAVI